MTIDVHIERLIIEGLPLSPADGRVVRAAAAAELERLLGAADPPAVARAGGTWASLPAPALPAAATRAPRGLGHAIAGAVYQSLGTTRSR